jgi:hypothetical protein
VGPSNFTKTLKGTDAEVKSKLALFARSQGITFPEGSTGQEQLTIVGEAIISLVSHHAKQQRLRELTAQQQQDLLAQAATEGEL